MSTFGKHKYATPLGALLASEVFGQTGVGSYSYAGYISRAGATGISGNIDAPPICGSEGMEFLPYMPTLTFPLNYSVLEGTVRVTWKAAVPPDPCGDTVTYDLQFTRNFSRDEGWRTLAENLPSTTLYYDFDVSNIPYTDDGALRIRAKDDKSLYSAWSTCNEAFVIANHAPNPLVVLSPFPGEEFDPSIPLVWREPTVSDVDGQSVTYKVEATDHFSSNTGWTTVTGAEALAKGTTSFDIPSSDFPEGSDYGARVSAIDEMGGSSTFSTTGPLRVRHEGIFVIDTLPPEGAMSIDDGATLAENAKVRLSLLASDATTGIKDVRFKNEEDADWSEWDSFANEKFWSLPPTDGVKRVLAQFRDYAGNISAACDCEIVSRVFCEAGNVTDIEVFNDKLYAAFDADGDLTEYKVMSRTAATLPESDVTALARFGNYLYVATYNILDGSSSVYAYDGRANKIFSLAGTKILTMQAFLEGYTGGGLFIGSDDNRVRLYDGTGSPSTVLPTPGCPTGSPITRLRTDGAVLFASLQDSGVFCSTVNGTTWKANSL